MLETARARIRRCEPVEAHAAVEAGAALVDIRSDADRERDGVVPGSLHLPRTVLEWRLEPGGAWRSPHAPGPEGRIVLLCDHGYSSILAAAGLAGLGLADVRDVVGGFAAWREAGLPVVPAPRNRRPPGGLPGMAPAGP
jgi:rhodanese-related sulfurtransferase